MAILTGPLPMLPPTPEPAEAGRGAVDGQRSVVALGGGHGLSASLAALRLLTTDLTAVVTVADDGGSSGRLRDEFGVLPPGDLRMALAALCDDSDWGRTWRDVMQHRFTAQAGGPESVDGHALGNLLIVSLWELLGDPVAGLKWAGALLGARGQVLPMATVPLAIAGDVHARDDDGVERVRTVTGQARLAVAGPAEDVRLIPPDPPACREALEAVELADWVVLGPGSWNTSILPHLLLPELRQGLCDTAAKRCLTMNLSMHTKETTGLSSADLLRTIGRYAPEFGVDVVLADPSVIEDRADFEQAASMIGAEVVVGKVGVSGGRPVHDPLRLAAAYQDIFGTQFGTV